MRNQLRFRDQKNNKSQHTRPHPTLFHARYIHHTLSELHTCIWWKMFSHLILNRWYWRLHFYMHPIKLDVGFEINGLWVLEPGHWTSWFLDSVWYWFLNGEIGFQNFGFWGRLNWNSCPKLRFKITCFKKDPGLELAGALASNLQVQTLKKNDTTSQAHPLSTCPSTRFSPFCKAKLLLWQIQPGLILWVDSHHLSDRFEKAESVSACFWNFSTGYIKLLGKVKSLLFGLTVGYSMGGIRKPVGFQISADPKHQQKHIQLPAPARNHAVSVTPKNWRWQNDTKCVVFRQVTRTLRYHPLRAPP